MKLVPPRPPGDFSNPGGELVEPRLGTSGASFDRLRTGVERAARGLE